MFPFIIGLLYDDSLHLHSWQTLVVRQWPMTSVTCTLIALGLMLHSGYALVTTPSPWLRRCSASTSIYIVLTVETILVICLIDVKFLHHLEEVFHLHPTSTCIYPEYIKYALPWHIGQNRPRLATGLDTKTCICM